VIVLHVIHTRDPKGVERLQQKAQQILADIRHQFITITGSIPEEIVRVAQEYRVADIVIGKRGHQPWDEVLVGSVSQAVLESSPIPVILVEDDRICK
jgi:nucleotide-binding universal stress UspA family protein